VQVHLVDGTYELFRHFYGAPGRRVGGREVGAVRGVVASMLGMLESGADHLAVATDHVIESFRNDLWPGYKTGAGIDPDLRGQFEPLEEALRSFGITVWPMVELEADDALASAAAACALEPDVQRVLICTPDKDLAQCVRGRRVVQVDRRRDAIRDEAGVVERFGVTPASIPDLLALTGDAADGFPGVPGWGPKSSATVLARYGALEAIPADPAEWDVAVRGAPRLATALREGWERALLFRTLATLRDDAGLPSDGCASLRWLGPGPGVDAAASGMGAPELAERARRVAA